MLLFHILKLFGVEFLIREAVVALAARVVLQHPILFLELVKALFEVQKRIILLANDRIQLFQLAGMSTILVLQLVSKEMLLSLRFVDFMLHCSLCTTSLKLR